MDKYDSTDYWYTYLHSLKNRGQLRGNEELEMDIDVQEKLLAYFKTKFELGVSDGQTALPPNLYDYIPRIPTEMLSKLQVLANSVLEKNPDNGAAVIVLVIVAHQMDYSEYESLVEKAMVLAPKDLALILHLLHCYTRTTGGGDERQEIAITALENLFEWEKQQDDTPLYQEVQFCYWDIEITLYDIYKDLRLHRCDVSLAPRIRALAPLEKTAFPKVVIQKTETLELLLQKTTKDSDFWEVYLDSLENRGLSTDSWELTPQVQAKLVEALKTKIEIGVSEGLTLLPSQLPKYVSRFPESMRFELRLFAEDVLKTQPDNGAAAKILAIIVWNDKNIFYGENDGDYLYIEQAVALAPNDTEICFFAISRYGRNDPLFKLTLTTLERLFEAAKQHDQSGLYHWLTHLYKEEGKTPCYIYRSLMKSPEGNAELLAKCKPLINQMQHAFQQKLDNEPNDWYALRGLGDIYETLGETELAEKYPWAGHEDKLKVRWNQKAWVGRQFPGFSAVTLDGTPISFSDYRGKLVLLDFSAKWCPFCAPEIPYIKEVYKEYHDKGFDVIGVSLDESEAELREYIEEHEIPWIQIFDGKGWKNKLAQFFGINSIPSQWLIDRDGTILSVETREEQLGQLVKWTETARIGNVIPDFTAVDVDGNSISTTTLRGKIVLLHFGYIDQEQELTDIDTLYEKYHKNGFEVIGFNISSWDAKALRNFVHSKSHKGHYIYASPDGEQAALSEQFGFTQRSGRSNLPAFILIDIDGKVIEARSGKVHSQEAWAASLEKCVVTHLGLC
ncbi:MAG: redoxin domain-containing protein [Candidatus Poribacteria bacterium]|nr:redoxin domain-containing protein [Candidatus Poribacteria bacterium]